MDLSKKSPPRANEPVSRHSLDPVGSVSIKQSSEAARAPLGAVGKRLAIIAALEREIHPLVRSWKTRTIEHAGRRYRIFENGNASLICGGIGAEASRRATEALILQTHPSEILSVGFAGALDSALHVGDVLTPQVVINLADGARSQNASGRGKLVTAKKVANREQKTRYAKAYEAAAVDMEAASVAQGAQAHGLKFVAIKAISDEANFEMPSCDRFVSSEGIFKTAQFALYIALRPWLWKTAIVLAKNSSIASRALCAAIAEYLKREGQTAADPISSPSNEVSSASTEAGDNGPPEYAVAHTAGAPLEHTEMKGNQ